ncbi:MAG: flagellar hook-associated protein FlgK [Phycisphaerales bacterium]
MGLSSALNIGASGLTASQLAIQITGNNLANAATPGYSRQVAILQPSRTQMVGCLSLGSGVTLDHVRRQVDEALQSRLRDGLSQEAGAGQEFATLAAIESILGELGDNDLSSELTEFFNTWSERANLIQSSAVVVQQGARLAGFMQRLRGDVLGQRDQIDRQLSTQAAAADGLLNKIAALNASIAEAGMGGGGTLRDQRDVALAELAGLIDITVVEQESGAVNVLSGSTPLVLGSRSRGLELVSRSGAAGAKGLEIAISVREDGETLAVSSGSMGALLAQRSGAIDDTVAKLDAVAAALIHEVNRLHATGTNAAGLASATGTLSVPLADRTLAMNDPANATCAGLAFQAVDGGFTVEVRGPGGARQTVRIDVDCDGRNAAGDSGFDDDTSIEDIRAAIDGIDGLSATFTADGRLDIKADTGFSFSFADDSADVLATLGVNSYFTGNDASDIGVRAALSESPNLLTTGRMVNGQFVENGTALAIAGLRDAANAGLDGRSITSAWIDSVQRLGVKTDAASANAEAAATVREGLEAQRQSVSGVNIDEESVNLLTYQRQYQASARLITVVDQLTQELLAIV